MAKVWALGCGLVGRFVIEKIIGDGHQVGVVDLRIPDEVLEQDLVDGRMGDVFAILEEILKENDSSLFLNLLPGSIGADVRKLIIAEGHSIIDLSFSNEDPSIDNGAALNSGGRILWDIGIAPGLSNLLMAEGKRRFGRLKYGSIKVGGNPSQSGGKWSYMAPFSPGDVIAEYTRPARIIENGIIKTVPAISDKHLISVAGKGKMEAFLTDGLRSILKTIEAEKLVEYTVRWPGHIDLFVKLRDSGELNEKELLEEWKFDEATPEFTWMEVIAISNKNDELRWVIEDGGGQDGSSMARTTGLVTACCALMFIENPNLLPPGIHPPEALPPHATRQIIAYLIENGVTITGPEILSVE